MNLVAIVIIAGLVTALLVKSRRAAPALVSGVVTVVLLFAAFPALGPAVRHRGHRRVCPPARRRHRPRRRRPRPHQGGPAMTTSALPATDAEVIEVGEGSITLAVVIDRGRLVLVLRALADTDVVVRLPITNHDGEALTRALAGSVRWVHPARECPACGRTPSPTDHQEAHR